MKNPIHLAVLVLTIAVSSCSTSVQRRSNVLEYLYPQGQDVLLADDVRLELPLSIGLAFVPETRTHGSPVLVADEQERLLERVRDAFAEVDEFERIEIVPASFVHPAGGFENIDQVQRALGLDLIVLVSFDQTQFDDPNVASITYWTILGAYVVPGNENATHTLVNASAFDIDSRALLLHAQGKSILEGRSTAVDLERSLREDRQEGFEIAVDELIVNLQASLGEFREQVEQGTIRGEGTARVEVTSTGGTGVGGFGWLELALVLVLVGLGGLGDRSRCTP